MGEKELYVARQGGKHAQIILLLHGYYVPRMQQSQH